MPSNALPSSTLELSSLQPEDSPSAVDIRPLLNTIRDPNINAAFTLLQQAVDVIQQVLRGASPRLEAISIGSADIADLTVSGEFGPGSFQVLNGPPNYDQIGWIGSQAKSTSVAITSIVAGLVTAAAPHELKIGDNVYIEQTTDINNTGYYVVATVPLATTFTVTGGVAGGNSTGGFMTKQFQGMWVKMFAAGGTAFDNAPFRVDVDGSLTIENATIILIGTGSTIELDPITGSIIVTETGAGGPPYSQIEITAGRIYMREVGAGAGSEESIIAPKSILLQGDATNLYQIQLETGSTASFLEIFGHAATLTQAQQIQLLGYSGTSANGPLIGLYQYRGTGAASTATQNGDTIGGMIASSFDGTNSGAYAASVKAEATETAAVAQHGAKVIIETTPNGTNVASNVFTFDQDGSLDAPLEYKTAGVKVVGVRGAALTAASAYAGGVFGATYTAAEQTLANALVTQVLNLKTRVDQLEARLNAATGHGLIA